jgi:antitoxin VapB
MLLAPPFLRGAGGGILIPQIITKTTQKMTMKTAKILKDNETQTLLLPAEFNLPGDEVYIKKVGNTIVLIPKDNNPWQPFFDSWDMFTEDFMEDWEEPS